MHGKNNEYYNVHLDALYTIDKVLHNFDFTDWMWGSNLYFHRLEFL